MKDPIRDEWHRLFSAALNDTISEAEKEQLAAVLKGSREARELWFLYHDNECGLAELKKPQAVSPVAGVRGIRSAWLSWRPLTAAAAGIVLGLFCSSVVWAYVAPYAGRALTLWRESFESGVTGTVPGLPRETGVWSGDEAQVVGAEVGARPKDGAKMLRFIRATYAGENAQRSAWGDVYRLVDLHGQVSDRQSVVRLTANFDATPFPAGEEYTCSVELCALDEDPSDAPQPLTLPWVREKSAAVAARKIPMSGDGVWQVATVEVPVSPQTRFVLVHLAVLRRVPAPSAAPAQFGGHYLDDVKVELVSRPSAR